MKVSLIVATLLPKYGIGYQGKLPWKLRQEMKYFREVTTKTRDPLKKNMVIMGRRTYDSIPPKFRPLRGRANVVLTRNQAEYRQKNEVETALQVSQSLEQVLKGADPKLIEEIFIIGGAAVYNSVMKESSDLVDSILLTEITTPQQLEMDTFFDLDSQKWQKQPSTVLSSYLEGKGLASLFQLVDNKEGEFNYDFTLWKKST